MVPLPRKERQKKTRRRGTGPCSDRHWQHRCSRSSPTVLVLSHDIERESAAERSDPAQPPAVGPRAMVMIVAGHRPTHGAGDGGWQPHGSSVARRRVKRPLGQRVKRPLGHHGGWTLCRKVKSGHFRSASSLSKVKQPSQPER